MNKIKFVLRLAISIALAFTFSCSSDDGGDNSGGGSDGPCPNVVTGDGTMSCGGQKYKTVVIGSQTWMAENLNYNAKGSVCYDKKESNCKKYGRLYDWATAMGIDKKYNEEEWGESDVNHQGICPSGWHIFSYDDWNVLMKTVDPNCDGYYECAVAPELKAKEGWDPYTGDNADVPVPSTDEFEFSALPGGYYDVEFGRIGLTGRWFSSTEYDSNNAGHMVMRHKYYSVFFSYDGGKNSLFSVRCVKD